MAPTDLAALRGRARRSYELARLKGALRFAAPVVAAGVAAFACGRPLATTCALCAAVLPLAVGLAWRGGVGGRAVPHGLAAGFAALALPLAVRTFGHVCLGEACMVLCQPACVVGGALAGGFIAWRARREEDELRFALAALGVAALFGAIGCTLAGAAGVVGMLIGAVVTSAPVLVFARR